MMLRPRICQLVHTWAKGRSYGTGAFTSHQRLRTSLSVSSPAHPSLISSQQLNLVKFHEINSTQCREEVPSLCSPNLIEQFNQMSLTVHADNMHRLPASQMKYILPTSIQNSIQKKTILDPDLNAQVYRLPTYHDLIAEKLTPGLAYVEPKIDPHHRQSDIDKGHLIVEKITMPYLLRIRHRKMKKHKLKKFRKRMIFLHRKLAEIKKRKKEKIMLEYQRTWRQRAIDYDPEKKLEENLRLARKGGYSINILASRQDSR